jgi:5-(carboxyamino)imidazole ribonucleotide synthase
MEQSNKSGPRLGIIGGGQLAKMMGLAALELGCDIAILERGAASPALRMAAARTIGDWDDPDTAVDFASGVDVVTLENEFVSARSLAAIERAGHRVFPGSRTLELVQDKFIQKTTFAAAGVPVPRFRAVQSTEEVKDAAKDLGWPLLLKARRNAYDGKGNITLRDENELAAGWAALKGGSAALYVEEFCPFVSELAVIITRNAAGESTAYPVVRSIQKNHICHEVHVPAEVSPEALRRALETAEVAVNAVEGVGSFGIELFLLANGGILLNEIAPRVHNSGHYTIEACDCSQFENHVRAVLGWPLGSTRLISPAAVMVNLLGERNAGGTPHGVAGALAVSGAHLHLYGKAASGAGRKMGHITALGANLEEARTKALQAAGAITFGKHA